MLVNLNNNMILQGLASGLPLYIMEFYPTLKPGVVISPVESDNSPFTPVAISLQRGFIQGPVEFAQGPNPNILTYEQYNAAFNDYYNGLIAMFNNPGAPKIQLSHIGMETLYNSYKVTSESVTLGGVVNITETTDYVKFEVNTNLMNIIRSIPELAVFGTSYKTFLSSVLRMFPEMDPSLSVGGSLMAYKEYLKLFDKSSRSLESYPLIDGMDIRTLSNQIAQITNGIDINDIRTSLREQNELPQLQNYIKFMIMNNIPSKVAINLLAYHPSILNIAINNIRGALKLPIDGETPFPIIFVGKYTGSLSLAGYGIY